MAEAQRPVHEDLRLDGGAGGDGADLLQAQLPCEHGAGKPQLRRGLDAREIVQTHLGARVKRDVRQGLSDRLDQSQILDDNAVSPQIGGEAGRTHGALDLPVVDEGVERHIDLAAADAAVAHSFFKFFVGKVFGAAPGVEIAHAEIYGVRSILHGGDNGLGRAGRRKQLDHLFAPFCLFHSRSAFRLRASGWPHGPGRPSPDGRKAGGAAPTTAYYRYNTGYYNTQLPIATSQF